VARPKLCVYRRDDFSWVWQFCRKLQPTTKRKHLSWELSWELPRRWWLFRWTLRACDRRFTRVDNPGPGTKSAQPEDHPPLIIVWRPFFACGSASSRGDGDQLCPNAIFIKPYIAEFEGHAPRRLALRRSLPVRPAAGGHEGTRSTPNGEHRVYVQESETDPTHVRAPA